MAYPSHCAKTRQSAFCTVLEWNFECESYCLQIEFMKLNHIVNLLTFPFCCLHKGSEGFVSILNNDEYFHVGILFYAALFIQIR